MKVTKAMLVGYQAEARRHRLHVVMRRTPGIREALRNPGSMKVRARKDETGQWRFAWAPRDAA